jgi:hypothetical protein
MIRKKESRTWVLLKHHTPIQARKCPRIGEDIEKGRRKTGGNTSEAIAGCLLDKSMGRREAKARFHADRGIERMVKRRVFMLLLGYLRNITLFFWPTRYSRLESLGDNFSTGQQTGLSRSNRAL